MHFFQFQARCQYLLGHSLQSCAESLERMCRPCCRTWYIWSGVESKKKNALVGRTLRLIPVNSSHLVTTLVMFCKYYVMLAKHACLRSLLSWWIFLFGSDADALCGGKPYWTLEAPDTYSTFTCSSLPTSQTPTSMTSTTCGTLR